MYVFAYCYLFICYVPNGTLCRARPCTYIPSCHSFNSVSQEKKIQLLLQEIVKRNRTIDGEGSTQISLWTVGILTVSGTHISDRAVRREDDADAATVFEGFMRIFTEKYGWW